MPLTVFNIRGIPDNRRERIGAAVVAGCKHASALRRAVRRLKPRGPSDVLPSTKTEKPGALAEPQTETKRLLRLVHS
jgi:hypothetical protein